MHLYRCRPTVVHVNYNNTAYELTRAINLATIHERCLLVRHVIFHCPPMDILANIVLSVIKSSRYHNRKSLSSRSSSTFAMNLKYFVLYQQLEIIPRCTYFKLDLLVLLEYQV